MRDSGAAHAHGSHEVNLQRAGPKLIGGRKEVAAPAGSGSIDKPVDAAMQTLDLGNGRLNLLLAGHVAGENAGRLQNVNTSHCPVVAGEPFGGGLADSA